MENKNNKKQESNNVVLIVALLIGAVIVSFFPKALDYIEKLNMPKIEGNVEEIKEEIKEFNNETLEKLHFPMMRNSIYDINTYYSLNEFTIDKMSNNDILMNAFLDIYEGNIIDYNKYTCSGLSKQFNVDYIKLRIKNILGKDIKYNLENFYVPEDSGSKYPGNWIYNGNTYIYNGLCSSKVTQTKYYNLEQFIKGDFKDDAVVVHYYVGFAKVEGNNYIIYSDASMTNQISSGEGNVDNLKTIFESLDNKDKKIYKYTFKDTLCSYNEYCLYKGEWVNEL